MGRVVLRCLESGMYQIRRGNERYAYPVLLLDRGCGWDIVERGVGVGGFKTFRAAREWLESADGQRWIDARTPWED